MLLIGGAEDRHLTVPLQQCAELNFGSSDPGQSDHCYPFLRHYYLIIQVTWFLPDSYVLLVIYYRILGLSWLQRTASSEKQLIGVVGTRTQRKKIAKKLIARFAKLKIRIELSGCALVYKNHKHKLYRISKICHLLKLLSSGPNLYFDKLQENICFVKMNTCFTANMIVAKPLSRKRPSKSGCSPYL